jgi:tetratricopeptide (TPR) repeat protein
MIKERKIMFKTISKIIIVISVFLLSFTFGGCKPKTDPADILSSYYQDIKDSNFESAYNKLSKESKSNIPKEDFLQWQKLSQEVRQLKESKFTKIAENKNKEIEGIKFKYYTEYNVTDKLLEYATNKEISNNYKRYVVLEDGSWKIYREKEDSKLNIASLYSAIGWMYYEGKGKNKNLNEAATMFKKGVDLQKDLTLNYGLAVTYLALERYEEAITAVDSLISSETNNELKSDGYVVKGLAYQYSNKDKGKEMFLKAIELNPSNEYAKTNLNIFK